VAVDLRNNWKEKTQKKTRGNGHEYPLLPEKKRERYKPSQEKEVTTASR
jgi:hypothetical protein